MRSLHAVFGVVALFLVAAADAPAAVLGPGTVAVVTTDGFFVPDPSSTTPLVFVPPAAFGGAAVLAHPAVEWERGTDAFLVAAGGTLHRVVVLALNPSQFTVTDLTPASAQPLDLYDLDLDPATGELLAVDLAADVLLRFAPPFAAGMNPVATLPIAGGARAIAIDTRSGPNAVDHVESHQVTRLPQDGSASSLVMNIDFAVGLDHDPQVAGSQGVFVTAKGANVVGRATGNPNLMLDLNYSGLCAPLALAPVDVEWDPSSQRAFVLAEDGINPACGGAVVALGKNHVVRMPLAQGPVAPTLYTFAGGSGVTGTNGDLAVVTGDYAFVSPVGSPCPGAGPVLDLAGAGLTTSSTSATLTIVAAPANTAVVILAATANALAPLPSGCLVLASPALVFVLGTTTATGALGVAIPISPLPPDLDVTLQAGCVAPGVSLSERLALHVGP